MLAEVRLIILGMPVLEVFDLDKLDLNGLAGLLTGVLDNVFIRIHIGKTVDSIGQQWYYVYLFRHFLILSRQLQLPQPPE